MYHIFLDSVGETVVEMANNPVVSLIPLTINFGNEEVVADGHLTQGEILEKVAGSESCPKTACPAPGVFLEAIENCPADEVYVVCVSTNLSGSYGSAMLAKDMYDGDKKVMVIDSKSASAGQGLLVYKIDEWKKQGKTFEEIGELVQNKIKDLQTVFVLEDLTFLEQNGRLTGLSLVIAKKMSIVPVLQATRMGTIEKYSQGIGVKKALRVLSDRIIADLNKVYSDVVVVSVCNCDDKYEYIKSKVNEAFPDVLVLKANTGDCATIYAGDKGVVVAY